MIKTLYRYEIDYKNLDGDTDVYLRELPIVRETDRCYFIDSSYFYPRKEKRVLKGAMNTYAYETKEKAKDHFIRRTTTRIAWFEYWIKECKKGLKIIKQIHHT